MCAAYCYNCRRGFCHRCKKRFLRFFKFWSRFFTFLTLYFIFQTFSIFKNTLAKFRVASRLTRSKLAPCPAGAWPANCCCDVYVAVNDCLCPTLICIRNKDSASCGDWRLTIFSRSSLTISFRICDQDTIGFLWVKRGIMSLMCGIKGRRFISPC